MTSRAELEYWTRRRQKLALSAYFKTLGFKQPEPAPIRATITFRSLDQTAPRIGEEG